MNNINYNTYQPQYNHPINYQQSLPPPSNQIPPNYEYFPGIMPYMNLPVMGNSIEEQKMFPIQEYYLEGPGNMLSQKDSTNDASIMEYIKDYNVYATEVTIVYSSNNWQKYTVVIE